MTRHLIIRGRVQGVGYRDWMARRARTLGLHGWVRNQPDGTVAALVHGEDAAVDAMLSACWTGPALAHVTAVQASQADPPATTEFAILR